LEHHEVLLEPRGRAFMLVLQSRLPSFIVSPRVEEKASQSASAEVPEKAKVDFNFETGIVTRYLNNQ